MPEEAKKMPEEGIQRCREPLEQYWEGLRSLEETHQELTLIGEDYGLTLEEVQKAIGWDGKT